MTAHCGGRTSGGSTGSDRGLSLNVPGACRLADISDACRQLPQPLLNNSTVSKADTKPRERAIDTAPRRDASTSNPTLWRDGEVIGRPSS